MTMVEVDVVDGELRVQLQGMHKIWALKNTISVPMAHVVRAAPDTSTDSPHGVRSPGTHIPGVITAGTWHHNGEKVFWDVQDPAQAVVIELRDESFARLVLQVAEPAATVELINSYGSH